MSYINYLNRIDFPILAEYFLSITRRDWVLNNQTQNQSITNEENSSEYQTENSDKGLKILHLKYA